MRAAAIVFAAIAINLGLYLLMEGMISRDRVRVLDLFDAQTIEFVRSPMEDETRTKDRRRKPPPKPREIKKPKAQVDNIASRSELPADFQAFNVASLLGEGGGIGLGQRIVAGTGEAMKTVMASDLTTVSRIPPRYPFNALQRSQEGWVKLTFIVTEQGTVRDPEVLDADPKGAFEKAAIEAVSRWRFRPVMEDGQPRSVRALVDIDFEIPE
ncbi:MAG: energy transducer TonB [Pseudomonadota bacterium]